MCQNNFLETKPKQNLQTCKMTKSECHVQLPHIIFIIKNNIMLRLKPKRSQSCSSWFLLNLEWKSKRDAWWNVTPRVWFIWKSNSALFVQCVFCQEQLKLQSTIITLVTTSMGSTVQSCLQICGWNGFNLLDVCHLEL